MSRPARKSQPSFFDAGSRAATAPQQRKTGAFEHFCQADDCKAWGAYGFGPGRAETKRWLCGDHRHLGDAAPVRAAEV